MIAKENDTRSAIKAEEHFKKGLYFFYQNFDRVLAMYHFGQTVRYQPSHTKGWKFYLKSIFFPKFLLK